MTAFACKFYGGPLAGQTHMIDNPPTRYRVPSYTRPRLTESLPVPIDASYEIEEYQLGPGFDGANYGYTWINPAESLRKRIKVLEASLDEVREQRRDLWSRVTRAEADANRWAKLKGTLQDLGLS